MSEAGNEDKKVPGDDGERDASLIGTPPDVPRLNPKLPPHPAEQQKSNSDAAVYARSAIATSAVTSLVSPIVILCLGGYWLDQKLKHTTPWLAMLGVVVGLVIGIASLLRTLDRLSK